MFINGNFIFKVMSFNIEAFVMSRNLKKDYFWVPEKPSQEIVGAGHRIQPDGKYHEESAIVIASDGVYMITGRIRTNRPDGTRPTTNEVFLKTDSLETAKKGYALPKEFLLDWSERYFADSDQTGITELVEKLSSVAEIEIPKHRIFVTKAYAGFEDPGRNYMTLEEHNGRNE